MVHHLSHQIHVGHEHASVALFEEVVEAHKALIKLLSLGELHVLSQLLHDSGSLRLISSYFDGFDEKLQGRFLQYDGGVRSLRLS